MNLIVANVRDTTRAINPGPLPFNLDRSAGLFDATPDGGRPRPSCPRREWFFTGFVVALESFPEYGADGPRYGIELDANPFSYSPAYFWPRELAQVFDYPEASA